MSVVVTFNYTDSDIRQISVDYNVSRCIKCILSASFPGISFDEEGVCNFCRIPEGQAVCTDEHASILAEVKYRINNARQRSHDCVVLYSGGKDSSYSLYFIKKVLGLNPLAVTVDNGFVAEETFVNIAKLTKALCIEHIMAKPAPMMMHALYRDALKRTEEDRRNIMYATSSCGRCVSVILATGAREALRREIPFLMGGWSPGQLTEKALLPGAFLEEICKKHLSHVQLNSTVAQALLKQQTGISRAFPDLYNPLYAIDYDEEKVVERLGAYDWVKPKNTDSCSSNCLLNGLLILDHIKKYGFHPYEYELAFHVRNGMLSRDMALARITHLSISEAQAKLIERRLGLSSN